jgi:hypothetical protein
MRCSMVVDGVVHETDMKEDAIAQFNTGHRYESSTTSCFQVVWFGDAGLRSYAQRMIQLNLKPLPFYKDISVGVLSPGDPVTCLQCLVSASERV